MADIKRFSAAKQKRLDFLSSLSATKKDNQMKYSPRNILLKNLVSSGCPGQNKRWTDGQKSRLSSLEVIDQNSSFSS
ncbi:hypothetical protein BgiMline_030974 [Biomphalaria glabrata]|nr:hypothetical protein BgiMline_019019 [Biomphalaria glabrata]